MEEKAEQEIKIKNLIDELKNKTETIKEICSRLVVGENVKSMVFLLKNKMKRIPVKLDLIKHIFNYCKVHKFSQAALTRLLKIEENLGKQKIEMNDLSDNLENGFNNFIRELKQKLDLFQHYRNRLKYCFQKSDEKLEDEVMKAVDSADQMIKLAENSSFLHTHLTKAQELTSQGEKLENERLNVQTLYQRRDAFFKKYGQDLEDYLLHGYDYHISNSTDYSPSLFDFISSELGSLSLKMDNKDIAIKEKNNQIEELKTEIKKMKEELNSMNEIKEKNLQLRESNSLILNDHNKLKNYWKTLITLDIN